MTIDHPRTAQLVQPAAYSQVVTARGSTTVYVAGQVAVDERGEVVGAGDLEAQTTQVMRNVGHALAAAGATFADVVKITTYVVDYRPELRPIITRARGAFLTDPPPASTLVGVAALADPAWLIEIEAVAVIA